MRNNGTEQNRKRKWKKKNANLDIDVLSCPLFLAEDLSAESSPHARTCESVPAARRVHPQRPNDGSSHRHLGKIPLVLSWKISPQFTDHTTPADASNNYGDGWIGDEIVQQRARACLFSASHLTRPAAKERETVVYRIPDDSGCFPPGEWHFFSPCLLFGQFAARKVIPPSAR